MISTGCHPISSTCHLSSCTLLTRSEAPSSLNSKSKSTASTVLRGVYGSTHREGFTPREESRKAKRPCRVVCEVTIVVVWSSWQEKFEAVLKAMARDCSRSGRFTDAFSYLYGVEYTSQTYEVQKDKASWITVEYSQVNSNNTTSRVEKETPVETCTVTLTLTNPKCPFEMQIAMRDSNARNQNQTNQTRGHQNKTGNATHIKTEEQPYRARKKIPLCHKHRMLSQESTREK